MKKCIALFVIVACIFSGCRIGKEGTWEFQYGTERVTEIKLVQTKSGYSYSVLKELDVSRAAEIYSDIANLPWKYYGTNLSHPRGVCFLIMFDTGEYDLISYIEPRHNRLKDGKVGPYNYWLRCDQEAFESILSKYDKTE